MWTGCGQSPCQVSKKVTIQYIIAIEGGGSFTRLGLYNTAGALAAERSGGPSNPAAYGVETCARTLADQARRLLGDRPAAAARLVVALAGAADPAIQSAVAAAVGRLLRPASVAATSDLHALLHANTGAGSGILVISGTGAAVLGRDAAGRLERAGGWGTLLGDEGGAYALAAAGLRACARAVDGVALETAMTELLPAAAGLASFADFVPWSVEAVKRDIAALAPVVAEAAAAGDLMARACIEEEARRLAALVLVVHERLGAEPGMRLFEHGGLIEGCALFREAFRAALGAHAELQAMPCAFRGHAAVFTLANTDAIPAWACEWTNADDASATEWPVTEQAAASVPIDELAPMAFVRAMHRADEEAVQAVGAVLEAVARAIEQAAAALRGGGRIIYVGAGTSGRLGALDAAECPPTFGVAPERVVPLLAGGDQALRASVEGAEDDPEQGARDLNALNAGPEDFVVGIAASGTTPYVLGALRAARDAGAATALLTSNPQADSAADLVIAADTGPELLAGSTRLKAGTAAKLVLNMISTGAMARAGYVYRGRMVGMTPVNEKLRQRAAGIVAAIAGVDARQAAAALSEAGYHIPTAILMAARTLSREEAEALLRQNDGRLRDALR